ncbi:AraC family transcriptional regulator [Alteromonas sp. ASW11-19]|uniref:AraC family transcriptional regulator n=1 Tax=Alteromonas salexigens TaxID=2982530 RepID=A0ABT2VNJ4_9ALTE|nr:AraC family transcriptional regulator [Alteromonas salexigens]MCU7554881.1 AraC family transcriptional regulator [Alteromonas salexigens]
MNNECNQLIVTGTQPQLLHVVCNDLAPYVPCTVSAFSEYTFNNDTAPPIMAYVMSDLSKKHHYNIAMLKHKGCVHLTVFAEHATVPTMCELLRSHVDDIELLPLHPAQCERLQDVILPRIGCDSDAYTHTSLDIQSLLSVQCAINFEEIVQLVEEHFCAKLTLAKVASQLNLSPSRVSHLFKDVCGIGFRHYLTCRRLEEAETLLANPRANITSVAFELGFSSPSHFCKAFKETFGLTPRSYMAGNRQFSLDERFTRYQRLRLTILPNIIRLAHPVVPAHRTQMHSVG